MTANQQSVELVAGASPALPPRTDPHAVGTWEAWEGVMSRLCWSHTVSLPGHLAAHDVRALVQQQPDGTLVDGPMVYLGGNGWSTSDARVVAEALLAAADLGDEMAGVSTGD